MFDPFGDFSTAGYLRNRFGERNLGIVRELEHEFFRSNLDDAVSHLRKVRRISYADFLQIHRILFCSLYPWAGQDRATTAPDIAIRRGDIYFSHPSDSNLAVEHALRLASKPRQMLAHAGEIIGLFAYAHPFLDGNGRTIMTLHSELCYRAGFSIAWERTNKSDYLNALADEITHPGTGILDRFLLRFVAAPMRRVQWESTLLGLAGLRGHHISDVADGSFDSPIVKNRYGQFLERRAKRP